MKVLIIDDRRAIACNEGAQRAMVSHVAANVAPIDSDTEWLMISPYGEFPNVAGKQIVQRKHADAMVTAFNSVTAKVGRLFRGLPVYVGHPDVAPDQYPDKRRYGKITELEAREDGLYGKVAWNTLGKENLTEGYFVYPSPTWYFRKNPNRLVEPDELISVGLTNTPQIAESAPWTRNESPGGDAGPTQTQNDEMNLKEMALALGLDPETATEASVKAALKAVNDKAANAEKAANDAKAENAALEGKLKAANEAATTQRKERAKLLLDVAINEGRLPQAERAQFETEFETDFDAAATKLAAKQKAMNTQELDLGGAKRSIATSEDRRNIINAAVNELQAKGFTYEAAYAAVKNDVRYKAVFEAMQQPGGAK